jgi:hypothetical protein
VQQCLRVCIHRHTITEAVGFARQCLQTGSDPLTVRRRVDQRNIGYTVGNVCERSVGVGARDKRDGVPVCICSF